MGVEDMTTESGAEARPVAGGEEFRDDGLVSHCKGIYQQSEAEQMVQERNLAGLSLQQQLKKADV